MTLIKKKAILKFEKGKKDTLGMITMLILIVLIRMAATTAIVSQSTLNLRLGKSMLN